MLTNKRIKQDLQLQINERDRLEEEMIQLGEELN